MNPRSFQTSTRCNTAPDNENCDPCSPTLANTAGVIEKNLVAAHALLDQIEQALYGVEKDSNGKLKDACGGGLMGSLGECQSSSLAITRRLNVILSSIESVK